MHMTKEIGLNEAPRDPTFAEGLFVWARIGFLSFGGPAGQIALMHRELVEERRWISEKRFLHALNFCMLLPGPEAQQLATYIGWLLHGVRGGIVAGLLFVLPGFAVILCLSAAYMLFQQTDWLSGIFFGLKAAVLAIVIEAVLRVGRRALKTPFSLAVAGLAFVALFFFNLSFPLVILFAGMAGYLRTVFSGEGRADSATENAGDHTTYVVDRRPRLADASAKSAIMVLAIGLAVWFIPILGLFAFLGPGNVFTGIGLFFSKMAVVTFGGAYAVLAYVAQQAVDVYGWLKPGEMLDGLALAETTPGPLVLVLSFVGFLAAFREPLGLDPVVAGLFGAALAAWVTFVPCFLWIFLGAPYVEALRSNRALSGALATISAAVTGVILNLAIWFALHVVFARVATLNAGAIAMPLPEWQSFQPAAFALAVFAAVLLFVLKRGVVTTLSICALTGWLLRYL